MRIILWTRDCDGIDLTGITIWGRERSDARVACCPKVPRA
jgi:hypothetical protein